jgi:hypothetical protein
VDYFKPGALRHTFVTGGQRGRVVYAGGKEGVPLETVAGVAGHSVETSRKFYSALDVPPMVVLPLNLSHPDDPKPKRANRSAKRETRR